MRRNAQTIDAIPSKLFGGQNNLDGDWNGRGEARPVSPQLIHGQCNRSTRL